MDNGAESYRRFISGDQSGLEELICEYRDGLILYLCRITNDLDLAEEAAEDTFVRLMVKHPKYSDKASFKTWLYTIGRNVAIDSLRRRKRRQSVQEDESNVVDDAVLELERSYIKKEQIQELHKALSELKTEHRQILWLVYFEELTLKESAAVMNRSVHAAEMLLYRAKVALKAVLDKEGFVYENL